MWTSPQPREVVAVMFLAVSLLLGIPAAFVFVCSACGWMGVYFLTPSKATPSTPTGNAIIDGLVWGTSVVAKAISLANRGAEWVMGVAAVISLGITVVAAVLFAIARGLHGNRTWARISGIMTLLTPLLLCVLILTSSRRPLPMALGACGVLLAGYGIWALAWRFT
jgi:uncharacterized membrane protein YhdT